MHYLNPNKQRNYFIIYYRLERQNIENYHLLEGKVLV